MLLKMYVFNMFITAVCFIFLIKLRWPKTNSLKWLYTSITPELSSLEAIFWSWVRGPTLLGLRGICLLVLVFISVFFVLYSVKI